MAKVLFASGSEAVIAQTLREFRDIFPEVPLVVVSEFPPPEAEWIPFHIRRKWSENYALVRSRLKGRSIRVAAIILEPNTPHWPMRFLGMAIAPWRLLAFTEQGQHFRMRPDSAPVMLRHLLWRCRNFVRSQFREGGWLRRKLEVVGDARKRRLWFLYRRARLGPLFSRVPAPVEPWPKRDLDPGISVVIPSRNGQALLAACLPLIQNADEIIVVDNGSDDGTVEFLSKAHPRTVLEESAEALSFGEAVNRGARRARFSHVCMLNNDMLVEPGFLAALRRAFDQVPHLFSATAQIFLPEGARREETGKTVWMPAIAATDFPVRCEEPIEGEDLSPVLYGSGGCTLYDASKLAALGGFDTVYETAYVEDLDVGVRAWVRGWSSVYCAQARVLHRHRATTSRYFSPEELEVILESNFVRFLARFPGGIWRANLERLRAQGKLEALRVAATTLVTRKASRDLTQRDVLALVQGDVAVFPGRLASGRPVVLIASPYLPFPLSHGAAVRIYNLMRRAARDFDLVLVSFVEQLAPAPPKLTAICVEVVTVRRQGSHAIPSTGRPDTVEEFDSAAFHAVLRQAVKKWRPRIVQLEFTQMAQYAPDARPARTILVEHDITYDLYAQMLQHEEDWETRQQYQRWRRFETEAWRAVDCVVTMSEKDRKVVSGNDRQEIAGSVAIPNGVDLERFQPASESEPEPNRLLFIGSFAHPPNVLGLQFFLREVFPRLPGVSLHVIAGERHRRFWDLRQANVEVEGFVPDVRPAYRRAAVVIAPLIASAGTNIKILEAMAMGKAIVTTEAGIHGLDLERGKDLIVTEQAEEMATAILRLLSSPQDRRALEQHARNTAEERYGWDAIAEEQKRVYLSLIQALTDSTP